MGTGGSPHITRGDHTYASRFVNSRSALPPNQEQRLDVNLVQVGPDGQLFSLIGTFAFESPLIFRIFEGQLVPSKRVREL